MTSKEALEKIGEYPVGNFGIFTTYDKFKEEFDTIRQDLDQLEELEIENEALKQGMATLTAKNNLLQEECDSIVDTNEILSKEIKYLKEQNQELVEKVKKYEREQYKQIR